MPYVVDPLNSAQPTNDKGATQGAEEFRKLKGAILNRTLVSVKDPAFGAAGNNVADDIIPINNCIAYIASLPYDGMMWMPAGQYKTTAPIVHLYNVSIIGEGMFTTKICPVGCDGITFGYVAGEGNTLFKDFGFFGTGCAANIAIYQAGDDDSGHIIYGLTFENIAVRNYHIGVQFRCAWDVHFYNCWIADVDQGVNLIGLCFNFTFYDFQFHKGSGGGGAGPYYGVYLSYHNFVTAGGIIRPEATHFVNAYSTGFDENLHLEDAILTTIVNADFSTSGTRCVYFSTVGDIFMIQGGYMVCQGTAVDVIYGQDQAVVTDSTVVLRDIHIRGANLTGTCNGVRLGTGGIAGNVDNVTVQSCDFEGLTGYDISIVLSGQFHLSNNRVGSAASLASLSLSSIPVGRPGNLDNNNFARTIIFFEAEYQAGNFTFGPNTYNGTTLICHTFRSLDSAYNFPSIANGASATRDITVNGAALGDYADVSFSASIQGLIACAQVNAVNTVRVTLGNLTGGAVDLPPIDMSVQVRQRLFTGF